MKIEFKTTFEEALKAHLAFASLARVVKVFRKYGVFILSLIFFLIIFIGNYPYKGELIIDGKKHIDTFIPTLISTVVIIPFSILFGWITAIILKSFSKKVTENKLKKWPKESFGKKVVEINDDGVSVVTAVVQNLYKWLFIDPVIVTKEYIFLTANGQLITSIPIKALKKEEKDNFLMNLNKFKGNKSI